MSVGAYCQRNPEAISSDASIRDAAKQMETTGVGCLVIVDGRQRPTGLVTDRDLALRGLELGRDGAEVRVADVMSKLGAKAREATSVNTAVLRMGADGIRRLPVVDSHGRLAGIFSYDDAFGHVAECLSMAADVIRAQRPPGASEPRAQGDWEVPTVRRYHQQPIALPADASVHEVVDEMEESGAGTVVVIDAERRPIGIVTDRDVMSRVVAAGADPRATIVADIMSKDIAFSRDDASLQHVLDYAKSRGVRRIPLVDGGGRLVAIVSLDDVVAELNRELGHLTHAVRSEQRPFHRRSLE